MRINSAIQAAIDLTAGAQFPVAMKSLTFCVLRTMRSDASASVCNCISIAPL
uniref:Uncharacterized protein n=1 Tax=Malurus cyaneus samueli TaxID=2593467 RepID=A0A8C5T277_9PASS